MTGSRPVAATDAATDAAAVAAMDDAADDVAARGAVPTLDDAEVGRLLSGQGSVLLYFTASWCAPCVVFGPLLARYAKEHPDLVRIVRIDADHAPATLARFAVQAFPTLVLVAAEEAVWFHAGALEEDELGGILPSLVRAARALPPAADGAGTDGPATEPVDGGAGGPRSVTVPAIDDPRVRVRNGHRVAAGGSVLALQPGEALHVVIRSDLRRDPGCDTSVLSRFEPGSVDAVSLVGSALTEQHVSDLSAVDGLGAVYLVSARPLPQRLLDALADLRDLRMLVVDAPGTDVDAVRRALPDVMVNFEWTSPRLRLEDSLVGGRPREPRPASLRRTRLLEGRGPDGLLLVDHPGSPAPSAVRAALARVGHLPTAEAADGQEPEVVARFDLPPGSELLLVRGGVVLARRDTCGPHHVDELVELAEVVGRQDQVPPAPTGAVREASHRTVSLDLPDGAEAELVPPAAAPPDRIPLNPCDRDVHVPPGWRLAVRGADSEVGSLPLDDIDLLELRLESGPGALGSLVGCRRLTGLVVAARSWDSELEQRLGELTQLRRLVVVGPPPDPDAEVRLRRALPDTVVNGEWTHRELADALAQGAPAAPEAGG